MIICMYIDYEKRVATESDGRQRRRLRPRGSLARRGGRSRGACRGRKRRLKMESRLPLLWRHHIGILQRAPDVHSAGGLIPLSLTVAKS